MNPLQQPCCKGLFFLLSDKPEKTTFKHVCQQTGTMTRKGRLRIYIFLYIFAINKILFVQSINKILFV